MTREKLTSDQPQPGQIKSRTHNPRLSVQTPRLRYGVLILEPMARFPVPEPYTPIVAAGEHDVILVHSQGINNRVMALKILHKVAFGK